MIGWYNDMPEAIYNPAVYFKNTYEDEWIMDELSKEMILDVDKSVVISPRIIDSPVLGGITPRPDLHSKAVSDPQTHCF